MEGMRLLIVALLGACVDSFTNVVVWRLPRQESVVHPGSHCPRCGHAIRWHDNLPVLGWLLLRGRCRDCGAGISWRYPVLELASALLWLSALSVQAGGGLPEPWRPGQPGAGGSAVAVGADRSGSPLVSERLCRWGVLIGLLGSAGPGWTVLADHLVAAAMALVLLEGVRGMAERLLGQPTLGLGDAKLAALGSTWLGAAGIAVAMSLATLSGAVVGSLGRVSGRLQPRQAFAFGPFIALGIWLVWLWGADWWWKQWQQLLGF